MIRWAAAVGVLVGIIELLANLSQVAGLNARDAFAFAHRHPRASPSPSAISTPASATADPSSDPTMPSADPTITSAPPTAPTSLPTTAPTPRPTPSRSKTPIEPPSTESASASILAPANGLTTTQTQVTLSISYAPRTVPGSVWYVVIRATHHTTSDFLYRLPPGATSLPVGIGPPTSGSGASDDYYIRPALIDTADASKIGTYREVFAPDSTRYFPGITIHRKPQ